MADELLPFYNRELSFIRRLGADFAEAHPKIAGRLRLGPDASEDPHVERLIEAFAFLTARIRHKLDDDFPEIAEAMLGQLYPHFQRPIPSMATVQFRLLPSQGEQAAGYSIPRETPLETESIQGDPCRFQTCYPVTLWPIELKSATLSRPPFTAPASPHSSIAAGVLRLSLRSLSEAVKFSQLPLGSLRFYLNGQPQHVYALYELLVNNALDVVAAGSPQDPHPVSLGPLAIRAVGFERDEGLLPYSARSFLGYRLLTEYFTFPDKFLFVDITGLSGAALSALGNQLDLFVYLKRSTVDLERNVTADMFRLGCTPIVNLFRQRAEPIQLDQTRTEYRIIPDARRRLSHEVYSVDRVAATSSAGEQVEYLPFFSTKYGTARSDRRQLYWHSSRRVAGYAEGEVDEGSEVYLSFVDPGFSPSAPADWTVDLELTCLNRDLPHRLPFGGDQPRLQLAEAGAPIGRIICLTPPTRTLRPFFNPGSAWKLISHLNLNHRSLVEDEAGVEALRAILRLYDFTDSPQTRAMIDGVLSVRSRRVVGRVRDTAAGVFCRGLEVAVEFDEKRYAGAGMFLFASVLERFFGLYCSINSFSKMIATVQGREGELRRWPPRAGDQILL